MTNAPQKKVRLNYPPWENLVTQGTQITEELTKLQHISSMTSPRLTDEHFVFINLYPHIAINCAIVVNVRRLIRATRDVQKEIDLEPDEPGYTIAELLTDYTGHSVDDIIKRQDDDAIVAIELLMLVVLRALTGVKHDVLAVVNKDELATGDDLRIVAYEEIG